MVDTLSTVRRVRPDEVKILRDISISTFTETYAVHNTPENMAHYIAQSFSEDRLQAELNSDNNHYYFAQMGEDILGYLKLNTDDAQTNNSTPRACEIERIYVDQKYQGRQIGKLLFGTAVDFTRNSDLSWLWLGVWDQNKKAIGFYEKMGFEVFDRHDFTLGTEAQSDLLMRIPVKT